MSKRKRQRRRRRVWEKENKRNIQSNCDYIAIIARDVHRALWAIFSIYVWTHTNLAFHFETTATANSLICGWCLNRSNQLKATYNHTLSHSIVWRLWWCCWVCGSCCCCNTSKHHIHAKNNNHKFAWFYFNSRKTYNALVLLSINSHWRVCVCVFFSTITGRHIRPKKLNFPIFISSIFFHISHSFAIRIIF